MGQAEIFIGRQPIFTKNNNLFGYELLFRNGLDANKATFENAEVATATVLNNAIMEMDFSNIVANHKAFINFSESFFTNFVTPFFSPENIIIEILENVPSTPKVIESIKKLKKQGFKIALSDFIFKAEFIPFLQLADIIKINIENKSLEKIPSIFNKISRFTAAKLLAERVETKEQYEVCKKAGVEYFQGYYFAKPEVVVGQKIDLSGLRLLELIKKITDETTSISELETIISKDIGLTHKLLKVALQNQTKNMPEIETIKQVLSLFGLNKVKNWVMTMSLSSHGGTVPEVFNIARSRAIFLKKYAEKNQFKAVDSFYLVGLFSLIDTILKQPMNEILAHLPFSEAIKQGLLKKEGEFSKAIKLVEALEYNHISTLTDKYRSIYITSLEEALKES